jgi:flagellar hook-associated protein 3 FlgL
MAISSINIARVSQTMRFDTTLNQVSTGQVDSFEAQNRIASGRSFVTPSDDPAAAGRALDLTRVFGQQQQFMANIGRGSDLLAAADNAISEISTLISDATAIALQSIDSLTSGAEREANAELISGLRDQVLVVANRQFDDRYLFAGRDTQNTPFVNALGGVAYMGDTGSLEVRTDVDQAETVNVSGNVLFSALSSAIPTTADLTPIVTTSTRLTDIGAFDADVARLSRLVINEPNGVGAFTVDLSEADTVGDVADLINQAAAAAGSALTAQVTDSGLEVSTGGAGVTITDTAQGALAVSLGLMTMQETSGVITGEALTPRLGRLTTLDSLSRGAGIDVENGLVIENGGDSAVVDLTGAVTLQDVLNRINNSGMYVLAQLNEDGSGIEVFNRVSGADLSIGENGGTTATDLGIRTFSTVTTLDSLNHGAGIVRAEGENDLLITASDGSSFEANLDAAITVGDALDLINQAATDAGVAVTAAFVDEGNGIRLTDGTNGGGQLAITSLSTSTAAADLGFDPEGLPVDGTLDATNANPIRTEGIFSVLVELEEALRSDDTQRIAQASARLDDLVKETTAIHGVVGARSQALQNRMYQMEDAAATTQELLSQVEDLDFTAAITELLSAQTSLQASLQTSGQLLNLSLLDFLR